MEAEAYLHWLRSTDLESATLEDLSVAVEWVVEGLRGDLEQGPDETTWQMLEALEAIQQDLADGSIPKDSLYDFRQTFVFDPGLVVPPEVVLEHELREIAGGIARERWATESFLKLEEAVRGYLDGGDEEPLWEVVEMMEAAVENSARGYSETDILAKEITLESQVVHKLLCEGMERWQLALDQLRHEDVEPDLDQMLIDAEAGNRLLVAVQIYYDRLKQAVSFSL